MRTSSHDRLRRELAAAPDSVAADHAPVIITRGRGKHGSGLPPLGMN